MSRIAVVGASGFVGSHVADEAERRGHAVTRLRAPRLAADRDSDASVDALSKTLEGHEVVVNCAGNPDASSADGEALNLANGVLPGVIGSAAARAGVGRYVHVSSAVVQGRRAVLDSSDDVDPFTPYARSKIEGERSALGNGPDCTVVYRPPSVHGADRRVTRQLSRIARSSLSSVAAPGGDSTPQTHIADVASAVVFLATSPAPPPRIVHHPAQGLSTAGLLRHLGRGREPRMLPRGLARGALVVARGASRLVPRLAPYARRVEMTWFGQEQARSWLDDQGWVPVSTAETWQGLGQRLFDEAPTTTKGRR